MRTPRCPGLIRDSEGRRLAALARLVPRGQAIVEVGSHTGLSTVWMARSAARRRQGPRVFAVDPWRDPRPGTLDDPFGLVTGDAVMAKFKENMAAERVESHVVPLRLTSVEAAAMWALMPGDVGLPVGLCFIDAIHELDAVAEDYRAWEPFIPVGGWLALHDYAPWPGHPYYGVAQAVEQVIMASGQWADVVVVDELWTARKAS